MVTCSPPSLSECSQDGGAESAGSIVKDMCLHRCMQSHWAHAPELRDPQARLQHHKCGGTCTAAPSQEPR
jgi:hypothetical protein